MLALAALVVLSVLDGSWREGQAPFPYIWRDVALVHLGCALPLAWLAAVWIQLRVSAAGSVGLAALLLTLCAVPLIGVFRLEIMNALLAAPWFGLLLRATLAGALILSAGLAWLTLTGRSGEQSPGRAALVLALATSLALPWTYLDARCRRDLARLAELFEQGQVGEAYRLAYGLVLLDSSLSWEGRRLSQVALQLDQRVGELEAHVSSPISTSAGAAQRLERARHLAMLGRTDDALAILAPARDPHFAPEVDNLRGTIHEARGEWRAALEAFTRASAAWQDRAPSEDRTAGLIRSATGTAFCQRKLGDYAAAEAAYQDLLALAPTAATHLLLARFYDDAQDAEKSFFHARSAIALDVRRGREATQIIGKLTVAHFGCLRVFSASRTDAGRVD